VAVVVLTGQRHEEIARLHLTGVDANGAKTPRRLSNLLTKKRSEACG
jgi:hypothetical protein